MSTYWTLQGELKFTTTKDYETAVKILQDGGWMDNNGGLVDEQGASHGDDDYNGRDDELKTIAFPFSTYRNIMTALTPILALKSCRGELEGTCSDSCFSGFTYADGLRHDVDLSRWARKELKHRPEPDESEFANTDDYFQALTDWQAEVENAFHGN